jgi:hypothetical protein
MIWPPRWWSASPRQPHGRRSRPEAIARCQGGRAEVSPLPQGPLGKVWSTNLLERVNEEIKRRTRVVGIFPNDAANGLRPTASTPAWWGRCCWSSTSTGSWRAAACSPPKAWPPSRSWVMAAPCRLSATERGRTQAPDDRGCSAPLRAQRPRSPPGGWCAPPC